MDIKSASNLNFICSAPTPWEKGRLFLASGKYKDGLFQQFLKGTKNNNRYEKRRGDTQFRMDHSVVTFYYVAHRNDKNKPKNYDITL